MTSVLVYAADGELGSFIANRLANQGNLVALLSSVHVMHGSSSARHIDINKQKNLSDALDKSLEIIGKLECLVVVEKPSHPPITPEDFDTMLEVPSLKMLGLCIPHLLLCKLPKIIFISSTWATWEINPGHLGGVNFFYLRAKGIKLVMISPGPINIDDDKKYLKTLGNMTEIKPEELIQPDDISDAVIYAIKTTPQVFPALMILQGQKGILKLYDQAVEDLEPFRYFFSDGHLTRNKPMWQLDHWNTKTPRRPVALITGASRGIGRSIALQLAKKGYDLCLLSRNGVQLAEVKKLCNPASDQKIMILVVDINNRKDLDAGIQQCIDHHGELDVLINNAGINSRKSILHADQEKWEVLLKTNLLDVIYLTRICVQHMMSSLFRSPYSETRNHPKSILFISSIAVGAITEGAPGMAAYATAKRGLQGFANCVFEDVRQFGIKVSSIFPGYVNTQMGTRRGPFPHNGGEHGENMIQPQDVADCVDYVLSCSPTCCPTHVFLHNQISMFARI